MRPLFCDTLNSMNKNIILIGMPGVGKSTVGVILAKKLGMSFLDSDLVIQEKQGKLLKEILREEGTAGFLEIEDRINSEICVKNSVIATGGSAVFGERAMRHFQGMGIIVYLSLSYAELAERLGDLDERGVVRTWGQTLRDIYEERLPLYEKYADITVSLDGNGSDIGAAAEKLADAIVAYGGEG